MTDETPPAVLANLTARMHTDADGRVTFLDDEGRTILDMDKEGCPDADGPAAARWLQTRRPDLWAEIAPTKPAAETAGDLMQAVRQGRLNVADAMAALSQHLNTPANAAAPPTKGSPINYTTAMRAARQGDAAALEFLQRYL